MQTKQRVLDVIHLLNQAMIQTGMEHPAPCCGSLNPHAGEHGLFGDEEIREIGPAIEEAKMEGIDVEGPIPPDSVFGKTLNAYMTRRWRCIMIRDILRQSFSS